MKSSIINSILNDVANKSYVYYLIRCIIFFFFMDMYNNILTKMTNYHCYSWVKRNHENENPKPTK